VQPFSLDFYVYEKEAAMRPLLSNLRRAAAYQNILDNIPLGDDPKSRDIRYICVYWIEFERKMRPFLSERFAKAMTVIIQGKFKKEKNSSLELHWDPDPVNDYFKSR
jgi:hypothetical protein